MRLIRPIVSAALAVALIFAALPATASPISEKRADARAIKAQIDALSEKAEVASEDWNDAKIEYDKVHGKVVTLGKQLKRIRAKTDELQTSLNTRADSMYRSGPLGLLDVLLGAATFDDFAATWDFLNRQNTEEARTVGKLKDLRSEATAKQDELKVAEAASKKVYDTMTARRNTILAAENKQKSLLRGVESEIAALNAADNARRRQDRRNYGGGGGGGWNWGNPSRAPRGQVVQIALRYLGRPYKWAASGPNSFDCSGFTMFVYAQVGVKLPHSSRAQINCGERVSRANLKPGDLVFFGNPIHHVGIYIGGGKMVHAPHTGDVVSIDPIDGRGFAGACRP